MTEFTRNIKPVDTSGIPSIQAPSGSLGADIANLATTGLQTYQYFQNKEREEQTQDLLNKFGAMETELAQQGVSRLQRFQKIDSEINKTFESSEDAMYFRSRLAQQRNESVRQSINKEVDRAEGLRVSQIESDFQYAVDTFPELRDEVRYLDDRTITEEEKIRIAEKAFGMVVKGKEAERLMKEGEDLLAQQKEEGVGAYIRGVNNLYDLSVGSVPNYLVRMFDTLDPNDPDSMESFHEQKRMLVQDIRMGQSLFDSNFENAMSRTVGNSEFTSSLKSARDSFRKRSENLITMLENKDMDYQERLARNLSIATDTLKLEGLDTFPTMFQLSDMSAPFARSIADALVTRHLDVFNAAADRAGQETRSLLSRGDVMNSQLTGIMNIYKSQGDLTGIPEEDMQGYIEFTSNYINSGITQFNLEQEELDNIAAGLSSILLEASATDDPEQIKNATTLLNNPNFDSYWGQLSSERQQVLGRLVGRFNQDVLGDSTDGIIAKIKDSINLDKVTFNTDANRFEISKTASDLSFEIQDKRKQSITKSLFVGFGESIDLASMYELENLVKDANDRIGRIEAYEQYEKITGKQIVHNLMARKGAGINLTGDLETISVSNPKPEEGTSTDKTDEQRLQESLDLISENRALLETSPEFGNLIKELSKSQNPFTGMTDGTYEVQVKDGQIVE